MSDSVQRLFERWVERHVIDGERLGVEALTNDADEQQSLQRLIEEYDRLDETLVGRRPDPSSDALPAFDGYRTIEKIGEGGAGAVYKVEDLKLGRTLAAKVLRSDSALGTRIVDFLDEARAMALFDDARIARIVEFRGDASPPVLLMEYVEGFALDRIAESLEDRQRAKLMIEIAEAIDGAHQRGIQHRDLKPANVLVDASLRPRILDFGLSSGDRSQGHGLGTPAYMAPEQLNPEQSIDARTDVYALGVMLYELLCGARPFQASDRDGWIEAILHGEPRLPAERRLDVPEPLQAIALKAMERDPAQRYPSAREFAADLDRWLRDEPVTARPTRYRGALDRRIQPHLEQIREWRRLRLIWPHEQRRLSRLYAQLQGDDDEWFLRSRSLGWAPIALYLGALLTLFGGLFYFSSAMSEGADGLLGPVAFLALPFVALNLFAERQHRHVAIAFHLAAIPLLPLFLVIVCDRFDGWPATGNESELLTDIISNRRLQLVTFAATAWSAVIALRRRAMTLASYALLTLFLFYLSLLTDFGLTAFLNEDRFDRVGLRFVLWAIVIAVGAVVGARRGGEWWARPAFVAAAIVGALGLELTALDGRAFNALGISLDALVRDGGDPIFLATMTAMALFGISFYGAGRLAERSGLAAASTAAWLLGTAAPFAVLQPISAIAGSDEFAPRFSWAYLALAVLTALLSRLHQRKAFYFAGLFNTALALWFITRQYGWWDRPLWALLVLAAGLGALVVGLFVYRRESRATSR